MRLCRWILRLAAALLAATASAAPRYELVDLGTLPNGSTSDARAINNADEIVGFAETTGQVTRPVRYAGGRVLRLVDRTQLTYRSGSAVAISDAGHVTGTLYVGRTGSPIFITQDGVTTLHEPPEGGAWATGINSAGQLTGWRSLPGQSDRAFVLKDGAWQDLPVPQPWLHSYARAINDLGQVVGHFQQTQDGNIQERGALWQDGALKESVGLPGSPFTLALAVNRQGWVTGYSQVGQAYFQAHAYIHRDGVTTDLETRQGVRSYGYGINASGEVVGDRVVVGRGGPFLYSGGRMWWLDALLPAAQQAQWQLMAARSINDAGHIAGWARNAQGDFRAVMLRRLPAELAAPPGPAEGASAADAGR